jgi:hypothetical protein
MVATEGGTMSNDSNENAKREAVEFPRIECPRWEDVVRVFADFEGWIFRGHCSAEWSLQSTLERCAPSGHRRVFTEYELVYEFKRRAHNYLGVHQLPAKPGEWLALMQHFGAPTRLVDFTRSPFVAAYFAFEELPADGCDNCAVLAISPAWCHSRFGALAFATGGLFGYDVNDLRAGVTAFQAGPPRLEAADDLIAGAILSGQVEKYAQTSTRPMVAIFEPERLTDRMSAQ